MYFMAQFYYQFGNNWFTLVEMELEIRRKFGPGSNLMLVQATYYYRVNTARSVNLEMNDRLILLFVSIEPI